MTTLVGLPVAASQQRIDICGVYRMEYIEWDRIEYMKLNSNSILMETIPLTP